MPPARHLRLAMGVPHNSIANTAASSASLRCGTFERFFPQALRNSNWWVVPESVDGLPSSTIRCSERVVASLDRKRLGQILGASGMTIRGVFDEETRRKALAFAADAVRYGI